MKSPAYVHLILLFDEFSSEYNKLQSNPSYSIVHLGFSMFYELEEEEVNPKSQQPIQKPIHFLVEVSLIFIDES